LVLFELVPVPARGADGAYATARGADGAYATARGVSSAGGAGASTALASGGGCGASPGSAVMSEPDGTTAAAGVVAGAAQARVTGGCPVLRVQPAPHEATKSA
jgi:hypothetical protein